MVLVDEAVGAVMAVLIHMLFMVFLILYSILPLRPYSMSIEVNATVCILHLDSVFLFMFYSVLIWEKKHP